MRDTKLALDAGEMERAAQGYDALLKPMPFDPVVRTLAAATGLKSTVADLVRYVRAQWSDPRLSAGHEALDVSEEFGPGLGTEMGLQWNIDHLGNSKYRVVSKAGGIHQFFAWVGFDKEKRIGAVMLANGNNFPMPHPLIAPIFDAPNAMPWALPQIDDPEAARHFVGTYASTENPAALTIGLSGELLSLTARLPGDREAYSARLWAMATAPDHALVAAQPGAKLGDPATFYANDIGVILTATRGDAGAPPSFVAQGAFGRATFLRQGAR